MAYEKTTDIDNMERKRLLNRNTSADGSTMFEESDVEAPPSSANHLLRNRDARYHPSSHATTTSTFVAHVKSIFHSQQSIKLLVLIVLSLQNSLFTVLRRYSQGIRKEEYSKYEVLMMGELIKLGFSAYMIRRALLEAPSSRDTEPNDTVRSLSALDRLLVQRLLYLLRHSGKMMGLALIYGIMNILSFVALRNIGAGMFTIFAQCKILTTAAFSALILQRRYSWTQWRALLALSLGVLLFSEPIWNKANALVVADAEAYLVAIGVLAVLIEVTLSGFASIYFEKVIKLDPLPLTIWERNFQLALGSVPVYICFILWDGGGTVGLFGGWSLLAWIVTILGAAGGLLVALSIKYGDAILKTLATTAAIILSSVLDHWFLQGPLTAIMMIAGVQVILSICNYTFDTTPAAESQRSAPSAAVEKETSNKEKDIEIAPVTASSEQSR